MYLAKIEISRPEVTFEIMGWLGLPNSRALSSSRLISLRF